MKKLFMLFSAACLSGGLHAQYAKQNIELLGHWYNPAQAAEPSYGIKYNGITGWVDAAHGNAEYAIIGSASGTHIIDISDPTMPVQRDYVAGRRDLCIWREFKTYQNILYAVSDDFGGNSFQIIDLSYLPDSVHVIHDGTTIFERSHTIFVDGDKLYCGAVKLDDGTPFSMAVYSLADPTNPVLLRTLDQDFPVINHVHDMFVRNDTVYASCGNDGLFIFKYDTGANQFTIINTMTSYPDQGYNHSSALTPDGKTLVFCDEVPENLAVKILDLTDITNIPTATLFKSNEGATPHNPYIYGQDRLVLAYYQDGVQIFDISNPTSPVRTGFFDTDTLKGANDNYDPNPIYHGSWGAYVDLPSGAIISSDMQNGLYVLDASVAVGIRENNKDLSTLSIFPNPAAESCQLSFNSEISTNAAITIADICGRIITSENTQLRQGNNTITLNTAALPAGVYTISLSSTSGVSTGRLIRLR
jgi:choice-of-anchor B domain-containing protein